MLDYKFVPSEKNLSNLCRFNYRELILRRSYDTIESTVLTALKIKKLSANQGGSFCIYGRLCFLFEIGMKYRYNEEGIKYKVKTLRG